MNFTILWVVGVLFLRLYSLPRARWENVHLGMVLHHYQLANASVQQDGASVRPDGVSAKKGLRLHLEIKFR